MKGRRGRENRRSVPHIPRPSQAWCEQPWQLLGQPDSSARPPQNCAGALPEAPLVPPGWNRPPLPRPSSACPRLDRGCCHGGLAQRPLLHPTGCEPILPHPEAVRTHADATNALSERRIRGESSHQKNYATRACFCKVLDTIRAILNRSTELETTQLTP